MLKVKSQQLIALFSKHNNNRINDLKASIEQGEHQIYFLG